MRGLFWFRSDLRLRDNRGLAAACARVEELAPVFVLDAGLLASGRTGAARVHFLLDCLGRLAADLAERGCPLILRSGDPAEEIPRLARETGAELVAWNRDYSAFATARDERVRRALERGGARVLTCKDRVVYESGEIRSQSGGPYSVYTPYAKSWRARWDREPEAPERAPRLPKPVPGAGGDAVPDAAELGFDAPGAELPAGGEAAARRRLARFLDGPLRHYSKGRDRLAEDGTSRLSPYLRFGAISIRECVDAALARGHEDAGFRLGASKWVGELVWREFYTAVLAEHPRVARESYRREYDAMEWEDDDAGFAAWCEGRTGHPVVDAGMRQLAATGWMHNRARMIVASFLTRDLLVDWRRGEAFFYRKLVDGDPASNNGGWQWAAGTGTDAQPYFRIFNPVTQGQRHDPRGAYVRRWVPELEGVADSHVHRPWELPADRRPKGYPGPVLDHAEARQEALERFREAREQGGESRRGGENGKGGK